MQRIQDEFHPLMNSLSMTETALAAKKEELKTLQLEAEGARRRNAQIERTVTQQAGLPKSKKPRNSDASVTHPPSSFNVPDASTSIASDITEQEESVHVQEEEEQSDSCSSTNDK
jgi:hypothetical protein